MSFSLFIAVALSSMLPVMELRGAIPFYMIAYPEVNPFFIASTAVVANTVPNIVILWILPRLNDWLRNHSKTQSLAHWLTNKIHHKHGQKFMRWGVLAILFIGSLPIPGTGSYTAAVLAFLFQVPFWRSMGLLFLGNVIAATIVTLVTLGFLTIPFGNL